jgi:hypothetical protein
MVGTASKRKAFRASTPSYQAAVGDKLISYEPFLWPLLSNIQLHASMQWACWSGALLFMSLLRCKKIRWTSKSSCAQAAAGSIHLVDIRRGMHMPLQLSFKHNQTNRCLKAKLGNLECRALRGYATPCAMPMFSRADSWTCNPAGKQADFKLLCLLMQSARSMLCRPSRQ